MTASRQSVASAWRSYRLFFSQFREHFETTGAVAPSGAPLARAITAPLADSPQRGLRVLEVGAGTGVFTAAILGHLSAGDQLDVYEINPAFEPLLQARLAPGRARGIVCTLHLSAICELPADVQYDYIISGLPLNNFPALQVEALLDQFMRHLRDGGVLSYFEYPGLRNLKRALVHDPAERARLQAVGEVVTSFLRRHHSHKAPVPFNLPPALAHHVHQTPGI